MRNLKKILALVLALMMVLSVMVTASAATFTDDADIDYKEAVEVMAAAGVLEGPGDGTFNPEGTLTRAEAAKIIAFILLGKDGYADLEHAATTFSDVPTTHWASGAIAYCAEKGIIIGTGNGFNPGGKLDGYSFAKMLLVALGIEGTYTGDNWTLDVAINAKANDLLVGMSKTFALKNQISREEASQMAFNAMTYTAEGNVIGYSYEGLDQVVCSSYLEAYLIFSEQAGFDIEKIYEVTDSSGSLLAENFGIRKITTNKGSDKYGNPVATKWVDSKNNVVYIDYVTPTTTIEGATYNPYDEMWEDYNFAGATYLYNGYVEDNWDITDLGKLGVTSKVYATYNRTTYKYDVYKVVSTEYYYAEITDVAANGNIEITISEAGYVIGNAAGKAITVAYDKTKTAEKQSANYKALVGYAEDTVLAVCVNPDWNVAGKLNILDVQVPTTVEGTVTASAIKGSYEGYVTVGGTNYYFANEYNQTPVNVGSIGTLYLYNGLVLGFVGETPVVTSDVVYIVDHFASYYEGSEAVTDAYGTVLVPAVPACYFIYAQGVDMDGKVVNYPVGAVDKKDYEDTGAAAVLASYATNEKQIKKLTAQASGLYAVGAATEVSAITINPQKISDGSLYYNNAEFVSLVGALSNLTVAEGSATGAATYGNAWAVYNKTTDTNKTVAKVFYWTAAAAPVYENVFLHVDTVNTPVKTILMKDGKVVTDQSGAPVYLYTHNVLVAGEASTITTYSSTLAVDYFTYYVDSYGVAVETELDGVYAQVENIYGNYITVAGLADAYDNFDITGIPVVDLTLPSELDENAGNGTIEKNEYVTFYATVIGTTVIIDCIYIVPAP